MTCVLCGGPMRPRRVHGGLELVVCDRCRLAHQVGADGVDYASADYFQFWGTGDDDEVTRMKRLTGAYLLERVERERPPGRLLEVGCASGELLVEAQARGWTVAGVEPCAPFAERANARLGRATVAVGLFPTATLPGSDYDAIVMNDVLEHLPDLTGALAAARSLLDARGVLAISTPDLESLSARVMRGRWMHYKEEHLHYLSKTSLTGLLAKAGFVVLAIENAWKALSLGYIGEHFRVYGSVPGSHILARVLGALPGPLRRAPIPLLSGNLLCLATKA